MYKSFLVTANVFTAQLEREREREREKESRGEEKRGRGWSRQG